jgi:hypothetical protein
MADDPQSPSKSPAKNEETGVLRGTGEIELALSEIPIPDSLRRRRPISEDNRTLFIDAMADPSRRRIAFDVVERNCCERFAEGQDGVRLYIQLIGYVQLARVDEAVSEFEQRFLKMLDQEMLKQEMRRAP